MNEKDKDTEQIVSEEQRDRGLRFVQAKCTSCGATLQVDQDAETAFCEHCGARFVIDKPANVTNVNNISADTVNIIIQGATSSDQDVEPPAEEVPQEEEQPKRKHSKARTLTLKIAITGLFTALSYGLYLLGKFCKLPFLFPSFLDLQFSELPALIVGFALGPVYGGAVVVIKCLLKMPLTMTAFVGEATDILLGLLFVLPGTILYRFKRNLKGAVLGAILGSVIMTAAALLINRFISIPFYLKLFFGGNWEGLLKMLSGLFPKINQSNFYFYYLLGSVLPFNLLRAAIMCLLTFGVYKRLSRLIHRITQ